MPELPEVEAARRAIEENCLGKRIKRSKIADDPKVIDGVSPGDFEAALTGKTIVAAHRKGKNMWLQLDSPRFPSFQFGMAGAIYIKGVAVTKYKRSAVNDTDEWPSKYSKLFIELDDGLELSFTDKRRFAKVRLLEDPASAPPISELGPDALLEPMTEEQLFKSLSKKKIGIKTLLLDQSFISGVGNWIADEVLYQARIHPLQVAANISKESCGALHKSLKEVIEKAVEVGADSSQYPSNWIFHSREKKPGKAFVDGKKIEFITAGGRTTAYVPELQKLSGDDAAKVLVKPNKRSSKKTKDEDNDDADEPESEDEESKSGKPKGGRKTTKSRAKKPPAKRKSEESADTEDADEGDQAVQTKGGKKPPARKKSKESNKVDEQQKGTGGTRKPTSRRKPQESDDEINNNDEGGSDAGEDEEDQVHMKGKKEAGKKVQTGRQTRKRAK